MKIAIPIPSPVPFYPGGIENLAKGLADALCRAGHHVEIVSIPSPERTFKEVVASYFRFYRLDLRHFDLVISLKYPGWMARSNNHISYLCHRLRGLYDTYTGPKGLRAFLTTYPFKHPGPWIRKIVRSCDRAALSNERVSHFFCLSEAVKARPDYFTPGCYEPEVLYPPSSLPNLSPGESYDYFLAVSRLDAPKRTELIISAMAHVMEDVKLLIVGEGPQRSYLETLAGSDPRVEFLGAVADQKLAQLYKDALAVVFVPAQEDFGLVTVEAMTCAKPVITCTDSGGPTELVKDGVNGFVCAPEAKAIAEKMSLLAEAPGLAMELGQSALKTVSRITWDNVVHSLLEPYSFLQLAFPNYRQNKKFLCVLSPYGIYPPTGGGSSRIFHLYRRLARSYNVVIISVGNYRERYSMQEIADGLVEVRVPMTPAHSQTQWELEKAAGLPISDVALPILADSSPMIGKAIDHFLRSADVVVASHPFLFKAIKRTGRTKLVVYEAHNVETNLKATCLKGTRTGRSLLRLTKKVERSASRLSDVIWATSGHEAKELASLFGIESSRIWVVPNGVDTAEVVAPSPSAKDAAREDLSSTGGPIVLFIASWHPPNYEALLFIKETLSAALPEVRFVVVGSVKDQYLSIVNNLDFPDNLNATGVVDERTKNLWLAAADVAINPVTSGSGTNLKMFDYMASALPIVTTPVGARGTQIVNGKQAIVCEPEAFAQNIRGLLDDGDLRSTLGISARRLAEERFDWAAIAADLHVKLEEAMPSPLPRDFDASAQEMFPSGWYPLESWEGKFTFRWSNGEGKLRVHNPKREATLSLEILKGAQTPNVEILADNRPLATIELKDGWQGIELQLPRIIDGDATGVLIKSRSWRPAEVGGGDDFRRLGIAIRMVSVR